jgi:hypothetical protein
MLVLGSTILLQSVEKRTNGETAIQSPYIKDIKDIEYASPQTPAASF